MFNNDMSAIPKFGEALPEGCYQFRVDRVDIVDESSFVMFLKCQNEPFVGKTVRDNFDTTHPIALSKLKSYYDACDYHPTGGSHDPNLIVGAEFYAVVVHQQAKGNTYANIAPWSLKSLTEGPIQVLGAKQ